MPVLKNDAMPKVLNAINEQQHKQWTTYFRSSREKVESKGEVAVLGSLFWELSDLIDDVNIYESGANKEVYAKFVDILNTRFTADNNYGYSGATGPEQEAHKNGYRIGVEWVQQALNEMVLAP